MADRVTEKNARQAIKPIKFGDCPVSLVCANGFNNIILFGVRNRSLVGGNRFNLLRNESVAGHLGAKGVITSNPLLAVEVIHTIQIN